MDARLIHRLKQAQGFVQDAALVFRPVGIARDAAGLAFVIAAARRSD